MIVSWFNQGTEQIPNVTLREHQMTLAEDRRRQVHAALEKALASCEAGLWSDCVTILSREGKPSMLNRLRANRIRCISAHERVGSANNSK